MEDYLIIRLMKFSSCWLDNTAWTNLSEVGFFLKFALNWFHELLEYLFSGDIVEWG